MAESEQIVTMEVTSFTSITCIRAAGFNIFKEAEAIVARWEASECEASEAESRGPRPPRRADDIFVKLAKLYPIALPTGNETREPQSSSKPAKVFQEMTPPEEEARMALFEQQTWVFYKLEGKLDRTRLLEECQRRAQGGDSDEGRRLVFLHEFHKKRGYERSRWIPNASRETFPEVAPDPQVQATLGPHIWALLIGNDEYPQSPLLGSVNDILAWKSYLLDFLGVPESHIVDIQNADRNTMVTALYDLRDNDKIKEGDHIIFAYSGHGSSYDAKDYSFEEDIDLRAGSIEALCPIRRGLPRRGLDMSISRDVPNHPAEPDISDREVLLILSEVHNETKANITVVLDCCHSGGGTRNSSDDQRSRGMVALVGKKPIRDMFVEADKHPRRRPSTISVRSPAWAKNTVDIYRPTLLAACQDTERAWEIKKNESRRGLFTSTVMEVLRSEKGRGLTCSGLIETIGPLRSDQKPRFDGKDTVLFAVTKATLDDPPTNATTSTLSSSSANL